MNLYGQKVTGAFRSYKERVNESHWLKPPLEFNQLLQSQILTTLHLPKNAQSGAKGHSIRRLADASQYLRFAKTHTINTNEHLPQTFAGASTAALFTSEPRWTAANDLGNYLRIHLSP